MMNELNEMSEINETTRKEVLKGDHSWNNKAIKHTHVTKRYILKLLIEKNSKKLYNYISCNTHTYKKIFA